MGKFIRWIKRKIMGGSSTPIVPPPPADKAEIEIAIDLIVESNISTCEHLLKINPTVGYWQAVFKALAYAESGLNPYTRYVEPPSLGKDAITKRQNTSEGLLQLSYQDSLYHGCEFSWEIDKNKKDNDVSKTIFNIQMNVKCGLIIMNKLVGKKGHYIFESGNYWAVLKPKNLRHQVYKQTFNRYYNGGNNG